jgi:hypothetical protein
VVIANIAGKTMKTMPLAILIALSPLSSAFAAAAQCPSFVQLGDSG